ncbi:MAG TPA: hypothetical protein VEC12_12890, partial [Bacteroidia bacterium]|nr:hypothetical protein [Bacteroidia bacterium]
MKAQGRDEIENLFRKGLGGYESEPDGHVWNAIQKGIKKSRRKFLWKILLPSVLLVAALGAWGVFYINENKNINGLTGKTGQAEGKSYNNSADAGFSESHTGHGDTGSPDLTGSGNFGNTPGYSDGAVNKKITTKKHTKKKGNTAGDGTFDQETAGNSAGSLTDTVPAVVENDLFDKDTVVEKTVKKDTIRSRRASDEKNKPVLTRRFTASLYARPVWTTL